MKKFVVGMYLLSGVYLISTMGYLFAQDYSLTIIVGLMSLLYFHMGQKMRKNRTGSFRTMVTPFLALAAVFFMAAADYGIDGKYINAVINLLACGTSYWVATVVSKK